MIDTSEPSRDRPVLAEFFGGDRLDALLANAGRWSPAPSATDRASWDAIPSQLARRIVDTAAAVLGQPWPQPTASLFARFARDGDRAAYERLYFARRHRLSWAVLAAAVVGTESERERFLDEVMDGVWLLCEETTWCLPAHERRVYRDHRMLTDPACPEVDIFAADTGAILALVDAVLGSALDERDPVLRQRMRATVDERILRPYLERDDWVWYDDSIVALNNWNPWIHSNLLLCTLRFEQSPARVGDTLTRILRGLDNFLAVQPADGGCDEGPRYWWRAGASLFECLETLSGVLGSDAGVFDFPLLRASARYPVSTYIGQGWVVNFADASAREENGAFGLLYRFGRRTGDREVCAHARALRSDAAPMAPKYDAIHLRRVLDELFDPDWREEPPASPPLPAQIWLPDTEVLVARSASGSESGLLLAAKGGHNGENHNHNDVGSFIVALDGRPLLIDAGVGTYSRETFSAAGRYSIWTMRSGYHNLPMVNGVEQAAGARFRSRSVTARLTEECAVIEMDIAGAYPEAARLHSYHRELRLERDAGRIVITDEWCCTDKPNSLTLNFLAAGVVETGGVGEAVIDAGTPGRPCRLSMSWDAAAFGLDVETIEVDDPLLSRIWGPKVQRLLLTALAPRREERHEIVLRR